MVKWFAKDSIATILSTRYYEKVWNDMVWSMRWENWTFELTRQSDCIDKNWKRERSFGSCQLMEKYHAPFIWNTGYVLQRDWKYKVDPILAAKWWFTTGFLDPITHADYCISVWRDAEKKWRLSTTFFAYDHRFEHKDYFIYF